MGLIRALKSAAASTFADQWKEFFYCDAMPPTILMARGRKRGNASLNQGNDNIISSGSKIAVADGQCMLIVEQGRVVDLCAEPGEYTYDSSTEPSIFAGNLGAGIKAVFQTMGKRFTYGGNTGKEQRVYYINTKELIGNKYGTPESVPFRVIDKNIGLDIDISVTCFGEYSYRITNPILFYVNVCGNTVGDYKSSQLEGQMKTELLTALQPAFAQISEMGIRYSSVPGHTMELTDALNKVLSAKWRDTRGIEMVSLGMSSIKASAEDEQMIKDLQKTATFRDPSMAAAHMVGAQAAAMQAAASNTNGAAMAFMGMQMANQAGGVNTQDLFSMAQKQRAEAAPAPEPTPMPEPTPVASADSWTCSCGASCTGKFCTECGAKKPVQVDGWTCSCGTVNKGKFCMECGAKKPAGALLYKCDKCGWEPEDPAHPPKFCPECGDIFDENDTK